MLAHLAGGARVLKAVRFAGVLVAAVRACARAGGRACLLLQYVDACVGAHAGRTRESRVDDGWATPHRSCWEAKQLRSKVGHNHISHNYIGHDYIGHDHMRP